MVAKLMRNNYMVKLILVGLTNGLTAYALMINFKLNLPDSN